MILSVKIDKLSIMHSGIEKNILYDIRFDITNKSIYTILGKNGSGKSTLAKAVVRLLDERFYRVKGEILFEGRDILRLPDSDLKIIRKTGIRYVFQDSFNSFDPLKKLQYYLNLSNATSNEANKMLQYFQLPQYDEISKLYPFEASTGMMQRLSFVIALLSKPKLLILDEPTSSIDAPAINLFMLKLKEYIYENNAAALLITQDWALAKKISNKTGILKNGTICESEDFE